MTKTLNNLLAVITIVGVALGFGAYAITQALADHEVVEECSVESLSIVSNSVTEVDGLNAVAVDNDTTTEGNQVPGAWTAEIEDATWIWNDAQNDGDAAPGTEIFTRDFSWTADTTATGTLAIATDNTYEARVNGVLVGSSVDEVNFTLETQDEWDVTGALIDGVNTLEITVTNLGTSDNPAGLLYGLNLSGESCEDVPVEHEEDLPTGEILSPSENEVVSGTISLLATYDDGDEINDDAVQWAVRSGTCEAGTGTVLGNVDGHDDAYSWDGMEFEAIMDTTIVSDGEYCFVFNPTDDAGEDDVRLTQNFMINNEDVPDGDDDDDEEAEEKVTICHIPPGNPSKAKTLTIDASDVNDHLGHGDHEGECEDTEIETARENRGQSKKNR